MRLTPFPTTKDQLKKVVQQLWDDMDPMDFMPHIESMPQKLQEVICARGYATKY